MNELYEAGKVKPVIDGPYKVDDVSKAFSIFGKGEHKGKVVITMWRNSCLIPGLVPHSLIATGFIYNLNCWNKIMNTILTLIILTTDGFMNDIN